MVIQTWAEVVTSSLQALWVGFVGFLPSILGAVIVFIIGWLIAVLLGISGSNNQYLKNRPYFSQNRF